MSTPTARMSSTRPSPGAPQTAQQSSGTRTGAKTSRPRKAGSTMRSTASSIASPPNAAAPGPAVGADMFAILDSTMSVMNNEVEEIHTVSKEHSDMIEAGANYMKFTFAKLVLIAGAKMKRHNLIKNAFHKWQRKDDLLVIAECKRALADHGDRIHYLSHQVRNTPVLETTLATTLENLNTLEIEHKNKVEEHKRDSRTERTRLQQLESFFLSQEEVINDLHQDDHPWGAPVLSPTRSQDAETTFKRLMERVKDFHTEVDELKELGQQVVPDDDFDFDDDDTDDDDDDDDTDSAVDDAHIEEVREEDVTASTFSKDTAAIEEASNAEAQHHRQEMIRCTRQAQAAAEDYTLAEKMEKAIEEERLDTLSSMHEISANLKREGKVEGPQDIAAREKAEKRLAQLERRKQEVDGQLAASQKAVDDARKEQAEVKALHGANVKELEEEAEMVNALQSAAAKEATRHEEEVATLNQQEQTAAETVRRSAEREKAITAERQQLMARIAEEEAKAKAKKGKKEDFRIVATRKNKIRDQLAQLQQQEKEVHATGSQVREILDRVQKKKAQEQEEHSKKVRQQLLGRSGAVLQAKVSKERESHKEALHEIEEEVAAVEKKAKECAKAKKDLDARKLEFMKSIEEQKDNDSATEDDRTAATLKHRQREQLEALEKERLALESTQRELDEGKLTLKIKTDKENKRHEDCARDQMQEAKTLTQSVDEVMEKLKPKEERLKQKNEEKLTKKQQKAELKAIKAAKREAKQQQKHQPRTIQDIVKQMKDAVTKRDEKITLLQNELKLLRESGQIRALEMEVDMNRRQLETLSGHKKRTIMIFATRLKMRGVMHTFNSWYENAYELRSQRRLLARFRATWDGNIVDTTFSLWAAHVKEKRRSKRVIVRMRARLVNSLIFKVFDTWAHDTKTVLRFRVLMEQVSARLESARALHFVSVWRQMKDDRVFARSKINQWYQRVVMASYNWGFYELHKRARLAREATETRLQAELLRSRLQTKTKAFVARLSNNKTVDLFWRWHKFARQSHDEKLIIKRFSKRWRESKAAKMLLLWLQFTENRQMVRGTILCVGRSFLRRTKKRVIKHLQDHVRGKELQEVEALKARLAEFEDLNDAQAQKMLTLNAKAIQKFKTMLRGHTMVKIWNGWLSFIAIKKDLSSLKQSMKHCFALIKEISLDLVFDSWKKWTTESINEGMPDIPMEMRKRIAGLMGMINISTVFIAWAKRTRTSLYQFVMAEGFIKRRARNWLLANFRAFVDEVMQEKREQYIILRFKARFSNNLAISLLIKWHGFAQTQQFLRKLTMRYIDRFKRIYIAVWRQAARHLADLAGETVLEDKIVHFYGRQKEIKLLSVVFHAWLRSRIQGLQEKAKEMQQKAETLESENASILQKALKKFVGAFQSKGVKSCFHSWEYLWQHLVKAREKAEGMHTKSMLALRRDQFLAWSETADEEKRLRFVVKRYRAKFDKNLFVRSLKGWSEAASEEKRNREIIAKFSKRFKEQGAFKALNAWIAYWQDIIHHRKIATKIFNRLLNQKVFFAVRVWARAISSDKADLLSDMSKELERLRAEHAALKELAHIQSVNAQTQNDNFLRKMMGRMFNKQAFEAFKIWAEVVLHREFLIKVIHRLQHRLTSAAFIQWGKAVEQHELEQDFLRKFMMRMLDGKRTAAFTFWARFCAAERLSTRNKWFLRMMMMRMLNRRASQKFRFWVRQSNLSKEFRSQEDRNKSFLRKLIIRMLNVRTKSAFRHWANKGRENLYAKRFLRKFVLRMLMIQQRKAFNCWTKADRTLAGEKRFLKKFVIRMLMLQLRKGFAHWATRSGELDTNRKIVTKQIRSLNRRRLKFALRHWLDTDRYLVRTRMQNRLHKRQHDYAATSLLRRITKKSIDMAFEKWEQMVADCIMLEMRQKACRRLTWRKQQNASRMVWKLWVSTTNSRHFLHKFVDRMLKNRRCAYLRHWAKIARGLTQNLTTDGAASQIINRLVAKKLSQGCHRRFRGWAALSLKQNIHDHSARTVEVFYRRVIHRLLFKIFLAWCDFCDTEQHERNVLRAVTNRMRNRDKYFAFSEWVKDHRQEKRDSHHVVMLKERWAKLMLSKVYRAWLQYLQHNDHVRLTFERAQSLLANQDRRRLYRAYKVWFMRINSVVNFEVGLAKVQKRWHLLHASRLLFFWKKYVQICKGHKRNEKYLVALAGKTSATTILRIFYAWRWKILEAIKSRKLVKRVVLNVAMGMLRENFRIWKFIVVTGASLRAVSLMKLGTQLSRHMQYFIKEHRRRVLTHWRRCFNLNPERRVIGRFLYLVASFLGNAMVSKIRTALRVWKNAVNSQKLGFAARVTALRRRLLRRDLKGKRLAWVRWTQFLKHVLKKMAHVLLILESKAKRLSARAQKQHAFIQWTLLSSSLHLASKSVKRLNRYFILHSDRVAAASSSTKLCKIVSEVIASTLYFKGVSGGCGGCLLVVNEAEGNLWTVVNDRLATRSVGKGLLGYVVGTGECVNVYNLTHDHRYDGDIDDILVRSARASYSPMHRVSQKLLGPKSTSPSNRFLRAVDKASAGRLGNQDLENAPIHGTDASTHATAVLLVPLVDLRGVTLGILCAVMEREHHNVDGFFGPDDVATLAFLGSQVYRVLLNLRASGAHSPQQQSRRLAGDELPPAATTNTPTQSVPLAPQTPQIDANLVANLTQRVQAIESQAATSMNAEAAISDRLGNMSNFAHHVDETLHFFNNQSGSLGGASPAAASSPQEHRKPFTNIAMNSTSGGGLDGHGHGGHEVWPASALNSFYRSPNP